MLRMAPKMVASLAHRSTERLLASGAKIGLEPTTIFWEALRGLFKYKADDEWTAWHATVAIKLASGGLRTQRHKRGGATLCEFCQLSPDSWFHRCYECDVFFHHRRLHISKELEMAAGSLGSQPHLQELFCRGNLPHPRVLFPLGLSGDEAQVLWHNRPEGDLLFPDPGLGVFVDGSSLGRLGGCKRAGWAVALTNDFGDLLAGAFGAVPVHAAPNQTSRDAEDYAVFMASQLCLGPLKVRPDCAGTVSTANGSRSLASGPAQARAHLWAKTFADHPELEAVKVKGHSTARDIDLGRTTHWEQKGNSAADDLAKQGARLHPSWDFQKAPAALKGISALAQQALAWTTKLHVIIQGGIEKQRQRLLQQEGKEAQAGRQWARSTPHSSIRRRPRRSRGKLAPEVPGLGDTPLRQPFIDTLHLDPRRYRGHFLLIADLLDAGFQETGGRVLFCQRCKCYYHKAASLLAGPCKGRVASGAGGQASRISRGMHPSGDGPYAGWRLAVPRQPGLLEALRCTDQLEAARAGGRAPQGPAQPKRRRVQSSSACAVAAMAAAREGAEVAGRQHEPRPGSTMRREFFQAFGSTLDSAVLFGGSLRSVRRCPRAYAHDDPQSGPTHEAFLYSDSD